jgi:hypothetical protein
LAFGMVAPSATSTDKKASATALIHFIRRPNRSGINSAIPNVHEMLGDSRGTNPRPHG